MKRIVSLLPSATEWACALGLEEQLVGRSHGCDYPPSVERLPVCTRPRVPLDVPSAAIDQSVKEHLSAGIPLYEVLRPVVEPLAPDVILTQSHCEVCAVTKRDVEALFGPGLHASIVSLIPNRLEDIWRDAQAIAEALQIADRGRRVVHDLQSRVSWIRKSFRSDRRRPRVGCIEWTDPLMAAGNWVPELVALAGGKDVLGKVGIHSAWLTWKELLAADPEMLIILPCGFDLARAELEMTPLITHPVWPQLRAVQTGQVYLTDGHHYFNRPGPRLVESLEILVEILHPTLAHFGHQGTAWKPLAHRGGDAFR